jgi:hypothetical protein
MPAGYGFGGLPRSNPADTVIPEQPVDRCWRRRCPWCGCRSLVNHCWWLFPISRSGEQRSTRNPANCRMLVCFVCLTRVGADSDRVFVFPAAEHPPVQKCCSNPQDCAYARTSTNGICCP